MAGSKIFVTVALVVSPTFLTPAVGFTTGGVQYAQADDQTDTPAQTLPSSKPAQPDDQTDKPRKHDRGLVGLFVDLGENATRDRPKSPPPPPPPQSDPSDSDKPPDIYGHDLLDASACKVLTARLVYPGKTDAAPEFPKKPLTLPTEYSAPKPGVAGSQTLGPSTGPIPAAQGSSFVGNDFEYHSDVKEQSSQDRCTSQQYRKFIILYIDPATHVLSLKGKDGGEGVGAAAEWKIDVIAPKAGKADFKQRGYFDGDTTAGSRTATDGSGNKFTYYQGTPTVIHWIDTPGLTVDSPPAKGAPPDTRIQVMIALLKSVTFDGGRGVSKTHQSGWQCLSGHTFVVDLATGAPMGAAAARTLFTAATAKPGAAKLETETRDALNALPAAGGFQGTSSPEFRDLGCTHFDNLKK